MSTVFQVRLDSELKNNATRVAENIGIDLTTAVRLFLTRMVKTNSIPFELKDDSVKIKNHIDFDKYLGIGKSSLNMDAQDYVNMLRSDEKVY